MALGKCLTLSDLSFLWGLVLWWVWRISECLSSYINDSKMTDNAGMNLCLTTDVNKLRDWHSTANNKGEVKKKSSKPVYLEALNEIIGSKAHLAAILPCRKKQSFASKALLWAMVLKLWSRTSHVSIPWEPARNANP